MGEILSQDPFQSEEFIKLKQSLINGREKKNYLEYGVLRKKEYYLLIVDNIGYFINKNLEIELEYPIQSFIYESYNGSRSYLLKLGDKFSYKILHDERERIINYLFNTEPFTKIKQQLIDSRKFIYLDFGTIRDEFYETFYFFLVDNKGYLLDKEMNILRSSTNFNYSRSGMNGFWNIPIWTENYTYRFRMKNEEKEKLDKYINSLANYEPSFLVEFDDYKKHLLTNDKSRTLFTNFIDQHLKTTSKSSSLFDIYNDDFLSDLFKRKKKLSLLITDTFKEDLESKYKKLLEILFMWGVLERKSIGEYGFFLINSAIKEIAIDYFSKEFKELYGGYFSSVDTVDIENYIDSYYTIDFLDHDDQDNIGFFTYFLFSTSNDLQTLSNNSLFEANKILKEKIFEYEKNKELRSFEYSLMNSKKDKKKIGNENILIDDVDMMNGKEFEEFIYYLFKKMGYTVNLTPASGDQGIDLVGVKNGLRIGIQTKRYSNSVSNKAIQEVVAGVKHYNLSKAIVITNNIFTKSAIELALSNDVVLWDRSILKEKINEISN